MDLLVDIPYARPSDDYLYARLRCRRAVLSGCELLQQGQTGKPQQALLAEYRWVYRQLNRALRRRLLPVFEYFELRQLIVALRYLSTGERSAVSEQLQQSLLRPSIIRILLTAEQTARVISQLEQLLAEDYLVFRGLTDIYLRQGPGGLEQALVGGYLQQAIIRTGSKQVRRFLLYLLDMRNLQALHKHLYWKVPSSPPLLAGGTLELKVLEKIWNGQDRTALLGVLQSFTRLAAPPNEDDIEGYLLQALTSRLQKAGRDPLQLGMVIDYLWRCRLVAREQGLKLFAERPILAAEVAG